MVKFYITSLNARIFLLFRHGNILLLKDQKVIGSFTSKLDFILEKRGV